MRWNDLETAWHDLVDRIVLDWPELATEQLVAISGNQPKFVSYIASRYDLTAKEAEEVVDLWLWRFSGTNPEEGIRAA